MSRSVTVKVSSRNQIAVPKVARERLDIQDGCSGCHGLTGQTGAANEQTTTLRPVLLNHRNGRVKGDVGVRIWEVE